MKEMKSTISAIVVTVPMAAAAAGWMSPISSSVGAARKIDRYVFSQESMSDGRGSQGKDCEKGIKVQKDGRKQEVRNVQPLGTT